jgi:tRNA pseudouridine38-40 synthase
MIDKELLFTTYRASVLYDGSDFFGFQSQKDDSAIQDHLEKKFSIFFSHKVKVIGASRTDSGVHAYHQEISFVTNREFVKKKWLCSLNALLPRSVGIIDIKKAELNFHPIRDARQKVYRYTLWKSRCFNPFFSPYVWSVPSSIDINILEKSLEKFVGSYDFTSFCSSDSSAKTKVRNICEIKVVARGQCVDIWFLGGGFLKQMLRIVVGTVVDIALAKKSMDISKVIAGKDRALAGQTAPARGLTLVKINYEKEDISLDSVISSLKEDYFFKLS